MRSKPNSAKCVSRITGMLICTLLLGTGCDHKTDSSAPGPAATRASYRTGTGTIIGTVILSGRAPDMATIPNQPCHDGAKPLREETVVTDGAGRLQNVIVYLDDAPPAPPAAGLP